MKHKKKGYRSKTVSGERVRNDILFFLCFFNDKKEAISEFC